MNTTTNTQELNEEIQPSVLTFELIGKTVWGIADIIRDEMDGDTRDYMEITLPLILFKRLLDIRQEYITEKIQKTLIYKKSGLLKAIEKEGLIKLYAVNNTQPELYAVTWKDVQEFEGQKNKEEKEIKLQSFPEITITTKARTKQEFVEEIVNSFENVTIQKIFSTAKFIERIEDTSKLKANTFYKMITEFSKLDFSYTSAPSDIFSDAYMYLISEFAESAGKKGGDFHTPLKLCEGAVGILDPELNEKGDTNIADITAGSATFLTVCADYIKKKLEKEGMGSDKATQEINNRMNFFLQEKAGTSLILGEMNLLLKGIEEFNAYRANTISEYFEKDGEGLQIGKHRGTCQYIVGNPPYGLKNYGLDYFGTEAAKKKFNDNAKEERWKYGIPPKGEGEYAFISTFIDMLNDTGKGVIVLPLGTLFKDSTRFIREKYLKDDLIEGLILLPDSMFMTTSIPVVLWVINKNKADEDKGKIFMINASEHYTKQGKFNVWNQEETIEAYHARKEEEGFAGYVEMEDIKENDFNLSVQRYIFKEEPEEVIDIVSLMAEIQAEEAELEELKTNQSNIMTQILALEEAKADNTEAKE